MASIDKRGNVWRARVRIKGFKPKTRSFDTKAEAEAWVARIELQLLAGVDTVPDYASQITLFEALEKYGKEVTPKKKGAEQELRRIKAWQKREVASLKLSFLTPAHFNEFKDEREEDDVSDNTIRLDLMAISALYTKARTSWGMPYLSNPIAGVELPSASKWRDRRLSDAEAVRFNRELTSHNDEMFLWIVLFALNTAARRSEILRLKRSDVNLKRRLVIFRDTKNGENRGVPLSKEALAVVEEALRSHDRESVFPMTPTIVYRRWCGLREAAELEDFRFHDLRHEATSRLFERGLTTMEVQKITGHKTLAMLLRYTQMYDNHVVERLDATEDPNKPIAAASKIKESAPAKYEAQTALPTNVIPFKRPQSG